MTNVPTELFLQVFSLLEDPFDLRTCRQVSRGWCAAADVLFFRSVYASVWKPVPQVLEQEYLRKSYHGAESLVFDTSSLLNTGDKVYWYTMRVRKIALRQALAVQNSEQPFAPERWVKDIKRRFPVHGIETKRLWSSYDKRIAQEHQCEWTQSQWTANLRHIFRLCPGINTLTVMAEPYASRQNVDSRAEFCKIGSMDDRQHSLDVHWAVVLQLLQALDSIDHSVESLILLDADWFWSELEPCRAAIHRTMSRLTNLELGFEERTSMSTSSGIELANFIASAKRLRNLKVVGHAEYPDIDPVLQHLLFTSRVSIMLCNLQFSEDAIVAFYKSNSDKIVRSEYQDVVLTGGTWESVSQRITVAQYQCQRIDTTRSLRVIYRQKIMTVEAGVEPSSTRDSESGHSPLVSRLAENDLYSTYYNTIVRRSN